MKDEQKATGSKYYSYFFLTSSLPFSALFSDIIPFNINHKMSEAAQLEVYIDGQCPLCRWLRERVERRDRHHRIEWMDYRAPEVQNLTPYTFKELDEEMHARRKGDGRWSAGYKAWLEVMRVLPRWRIIAPVLSIWPFTALGRLFYRWLAKRRYKLFGIPPPCDADGVCALHKKG